MGLTGAGGQANPPAFPDAPLVVDVELRVGEQWERITGDVLTGDPITIEWGRADEATEAAPARLSLTLRNTDGKFSPRNPRSPYSGLIGRNTPIRVRLNHPGLPAVGTYAYMPGVWSHYLSTPDAPALDLTSVVDVRIEITPDSWRPDLATILASKRQWSTDADADSWSFMVRPTGQLRFRWTADGTTGLGSNSTEAVPAISGRLAVRAVFDGAATPYECTFYTAPTIDGPWTQLGDVIIGSGTSTVFAGTAPVRIGAADDGGPGFTDTRLLHGRLHAFQLANAAGAVVADPDIEAQSDGITEWTGPDGLTWTAHGAARLLSGGFAYRFHGEVSSWPPHWSLGGHQQTIPIEAAGIKRRLGQGAPPVQSPLRRSLTTDPGIVQYWPMEDGGGSFASAFPGGPLLRATSGGSTISHTTDNEFPGSAPLPTLGAGRAVAPVPAYPASLTNTVLMLMHMASAPQGARQLIEIITTGSVARWALWYGVTSSSLGMTAYDREGNKVIPDTVASVPAEGIVQQVAIRLEQQGANAWMTVVGLPLDADSTAQWTAVATGRTVGRITSIIVGDPADLGDTAIGHIAVTNTPLSDLNTFRQQALGYPGETAAARLARLTAENNVPLQIVGQLGETAPMGPQRVDTLLTLLEGCARADGGILGEARDEPGLVYRTRTSLYNQAPALELSYGQPGLAAPFEPVDDDQAVRNDITVTRTGGSSAQVAREDGPLSVQPPPLGVGRYDDSVELNLASDDQLPDVAGWLLHLGTWDSPRYPTLGVKVHKVPGKITAAAAMDFGDRATADNLPAWLPPGPADALVQGYVETIEPLRWRIDCNATPAGPWRIAALDEDDRPDTDGSGLAAAVDEAATALSVAVAVGPLWTTNTADLPLTIVVGGEEMTVTAVSGTASPQTFTVVRSANGIAKNHAAGATVRLATPAIVAL